MADKIRRRIRLLDARFLLVSAPPNVGEAESMLVPAEAGSLSKTIRQLHSNTLYRVSVMAETEAGPGSIIFIDGKTLPAARESIHSLRPEYKLSPKVSRK